MDTGKQKILSILETVTDPEVPVLSIIDLGIVRDIQFDENDIEVILTPTYSGCPAMHVIGSNIRLVLLRSGFKSVKITQQLSPAWTTDWMTNAGKDKLRSYGIAPPETMSGGPALDRIKKILFSGEVNIECPQCRSKNTKLLSQFGSTACKALYQCIDCKEPFDYFKCH